MKVEVLTALLIWAEGRDLLSLPFERAWEWFKTEAWQVYKLYNDPDSAYYKEAKIPPTDYIDLFVNIILSYNNIKTTKIK